MARYSKIERCILNDAKFNRLSDDGKLIFLMLLVHPHLTAIGAMRASLSGLACEFGWLPERLQKAFAEGFREGMLKHDERACLIWLPNYLKHNRPESPNVVKSWEQSLDYLPECALRNEIICYIKDFVNQLPKAFQEALPKGFQESDIPLPERPEDTLLTPLPESVTVAVTEAVTGTVAVEKHFVAQTRPRKCHDENVVQIFHHWKSILQHPNAVLDEKRKALIRKALSMGYSVSQLCEAITGCSCTPHNLGDNERGQRYDGLHVILRDADQIDRFIRNAHNPPRAPNPADRLMQTTVSAGQNWLEKKQQEAKEVEDASS